MTFGFLNESRRIPEGDWHAIEASDLWRYNLHYFDDLNASGADSRRAWHQQAIDDWVRSNSPGTGTGWEPYPTSLRVVNWIKYSLGGQELSASATQSLATQVRALRRRLEYHLLGNHLFANAKALVFAGLYFEGGEADAWLNKGLSLLAREIPEQILADGGQFERTPMYHALVLEDVLDLINAMRTYSARPFAAKERLLSSMPATAARMLAWLETMTHPDGEIAFFNDAAAGIALQPSRLNDYAAALGVKPQARLHDLASSGYVRLEEGPWCALFDAAPVGPDYQPGHAHADTLSFELSVGGERLISNSGTSTYEQGAQRTFERATRAHNTVEIDGEDSSEVWAGFRVARRARPIDRAADLVRGRAFVSCAHDGYARLRGRPVHRRELEVTLLAVRWTDRIEGGGTHRARGFIPLHPGVAVQIDGTKAKLRTPGGKRLLLSSEGINGFLLGEGSYAPEFGLRRPRPVLGWEIAAALPMEANFVLSVAA